MSTVVFPKAWRKDPSLTMSFDDSDPIDLTGDDTEPLPGIPVIEPVVPSNRKCFVFERVQSGDDSNVSATSENPTDGNLTTGSQQLRPALTADEIMEEIESRVLQVTQELDSLRELSALFHQVRRSEEEATASFSRLKNNSANPEKRRRMEDDSNADDVDNNKGSPSN